MLDYLAWFPDATVRFVASDMILNIHSDTSYQSSKGAKSRASGHFFLGSVPVDPAAPRTFGAAALDPFSEDNEPEATEDEVTYIQQVVGTILYYARAVDLTVLMALSTIASEQAKATK